jgi:DNA-binding XRE family transcriptional regulator
MPTGKQIRAARYLVEPELSADALGKLVELSGQSIRNIEMGRFNPSADTEKKIVRVFDTLGIEFTEFNGLREKPSNIENYVGADRVDDFYDSLYSHISHVGGDVCLSVTDESLLSKYRKIPELNPQRMQALKDSGVLKTFRVLAHKSSWSMNWPYNTYKWTPEESPAPTAFYKYGDRIALMTFVPEPRIIVINSKPLADDYQRAFDKSWDAALEPELISNKSE